MKIVQTSYKEQSGTVYIPETVQEYTDVLHGTIAVSYSMGAFNYGFSIQKYILHLLSHMSRGMVRTSPYYSYSRTMPSDFPHLDLLGLRTFHWQSTLTAWNTGLETRFSDTQMENPRTVLAQYRIDRITDFWQDYSITNPGAPRLYTPDSSYWRSKVVGEFGIKNEYYVPYLMDLANIINPEYDVQRFLLQYDRLDRTFLNVFSQYSFRENRVNHTMRRPSQILCHGMERTTSLPLANTYRDSFFSPSSSHHHAFAVLGFDTWRRVLLPDFIDFENYEKGGFHLYLVPTDTLKEPLIIHID